MTFEFFCERMKAAFTHPDELDVDTLNDQYVNYKTSISVQKMELDEWIQEFYQDWMLPETRTMLKTKMDDKFVCESCHKKPSSCKCGDPRVGRYDREINEITIKKSDELQDLR